MPRKGTTEKNYIFIKEDNSIIKNATLELVTIDVTIKIYQGFYFL